MTKEEVEEEPLSPMARLFQSPGIDNCIVTMIGFKAKINPDIILDELKQNVSKHPRFCSKLSDDGARWMKTKVNVEDHVFVPDIDLHEINKDGDGFVDDYVSRLTLSTLEKSRPLWDIHILNVKTSKAEAVSVMRCHHSLGDGMSLMSLLVACTRKTSDLKEFPTIPTIKRREKTMSHRLGNKGWFLLSINAVYSAVKLIWNTIVDLLLVLAISFLKDTETPISEGAGFRNNAKRLYHQTVSLDDIKFIKNAMNMTINDVLLGVTQAALSRYLNQRYGNKDVEAGTTISDLNNLPGRIRIRAGIMVNLRQEIGIQPVADMLAKGSKCRWGNYDSTVFVPFTISLETNPLVPLLKAKSIMDRKKHSLCAAMNYSVIEFILNNFGPKVFKRTCSNTTAILSNIVGPVEEVSLHGNHIAYIALSTYGHSQALSIHFISYAEEMGITITVDPAVIPDPHNICDEMEESLKAMKDTLSTKSDRFFGMHG
ncbi:O-acyltransferase WSD1 C-terminal [Arabidopsis suecica]|uniref:O-acyltransferase WSD1 C-terminal n=1 Tax=Arabidopsis suecica TaxID=45249 RepID=A0A8T1XUF8_ARASU|nr:O-acyltransferase WSD1 C-terminal [Arabidopsis suecica]